MKRLVILVFTFFVFSISTTAHARVRHRSFPKCRRDQALVTDIYISVLPALRGVRFACNREFTGGMSPSGKFEGVTIERCGSETVRCSTTASMQNPACKIESVYSQTVNTQVEKLLRKHGINVSSNYNVATAFTVYVIQSLSNCSDYFRVLKEKNDFFKKFMTVSLVLSSMINNAKIVQFQKLVDFFIKNRILK